MGGLPSKALAGNPVRPIKATKTAENVFQVPLFFLIDTTNAGFKGFQCV